VSDLSSEARALLRSARAEALPSGAERARSAVALKAILATATPAATATATAAASSSAAGAGLVAKAKVLVALGAVFVAAGGTAAVHSALTSSAHPRGAEAPFQAPEVRLSAQTSLPKPSSEPNRTLKEFGPKRRPLQPGESATPSESMTISKEWAHSAERPSSSEHLPRAPAASTGTQGTGDDLDLLSGARQALASHQAGTALVLLDEDRKKFPRSPYGEERSYTRVRALCELGRTAEARAEVDGFVRAWPSSMYSAGIRRSCGWRPDTGNVTKVP
jgi:hypothetical protein